MKNKQDRKPIPIALYLYSCHFCSDEYSWPASDLFWSDSVGDWMCDNCWDEEETHQTVEGEIKKYGISLEDELNSQAEIRGDNEEHEANAKLIAAAPEMLEALRRVDNYSTQPGEYDWIGFCKEALEPVRHAIKLAMKGRR